MIGRCRFGVLDERGDASVLRAADADALPDTCELVRAGVGPGLGVGNVDRVVPGDEDAARAAELPPLVEELAVLIEDLDAVVLAIADEQTSPRVHRDRVRLAHFTAARAFLPPLLDVLPILVEADDAIVPAVAMAVGDEDVAARRDDHVRGLIEQIGRGAADAGLAERTEHLALRAELEHLMAL